MTLSSAVNTSIEAIDQLKKFLPTQAPLPFFVHHNPLHAWDAYPFEEGTQKASAEELQIPDASLALIFGSGIIHHLDLEAFFAEAKRVLQPQGRILFMEPLGHNPLINAYRNRTPGMRTPDEHPLLKKDLENLSQHFSNLNIKYYYFWSLFAIPFRRFWVFKPMLSLLDGMDQLMFKMLPFSRTWAWYALIDASFPKATKK